MAIDFGFIAAQPFAGRNRGRVISSSIFSKATSTGMSSYQRLGGLRAIDDVGHHPRPLVEFDDGDRVGRGEARHRAVVDHIAVEPALAAGREDADLARGAVRAERARREIDLAGRSCSAAGAIRRPRVPSQKCCVSGVGCGRGALSFGHRSHPSWLIRIKIDACARLAANENLAAPAMRGGADDHPRLCPHDGGLQRRDEPAPLRRRRRASATPSGGATAARSGARSTARWSTSCGATASG